MALTATKFFVFEFGSDVLTLEQGAIIHRDLSVILSASGLNPGTHRLAQGVLKDSSYDLIKGLAGFSEYPNGDFNELLTTLGLQIIEITDEV